MSAEECGQLLAMLRGCGAFDCILADMDSAFDACVKAVFTAADKILLVERAEGSGAEKTAAFLARPFAPVQRIACTVLSFPKRQ